MKLLCPAELPVSSGGASSVHGIGTGALLRENAGMGRPNYRSMGCEPDVSTADGSWWFCLDRVVWRGLGVLV